MTQRICPLEVLRLSTRDAPALSWIMDMARDAGETASVSGGGLQETARSMGRNRKGKRMTERYNYIDSNKAHEMRCVHALIIMVLGAAEIIHDQFFD